jgi:dethiobiotin synthetase
LRPFRVFVTATDTGVGKTEVACALLSLLAEAGRRPAPFKPYESGCADLSAPSDAVRLRTAAHSRDALALICPHRFRAAVAPGVAAYREGREPSFRTTLAAFHAFDGRSLVAEGAGGLFVPIDSRRDVIDLVARLRLPVVLVARAGLGTLNHTALSLGALSARRIPVRAVVLSKSASGPDVSERDNPRVLENRYGVRVLGPVPFARSETKRIDAFRQTVAPLIG